MKVARKRRGGANSPCPECGGVTRVRATRRSQDSLVYRLRQCVRAKCDHRFWTSESRLTGREPSDVRSRPSSNRGARRRAGKK